MLQEVVIFLPILFSVFVFLENFGYFKDLTNLTIMHNYRVSLTRPSGPMLSPDAATTNMSTQ